MAKPNEEHSGELLMLDSSDEDKDFAFSNLGKSDGDDDDQDEPKKRKKPGIVLRISKKRIRFSQYYDPLAEGGD